MDAVDGAHHRNEQANTIYVIQDNIQGLVSVPSDLNDNIKLLKEYGYEDISKECLNKTRAGRCGAVAPHRG